MKRSNKEGKKQKETETEIKGGRCRATEMQKEEEGGCMDERSSAQGWGGVC